MSDLESLQKKLLNDPKMREKFIMDAKDLLHKHGVDTENDEIKEKLGLTPGNMKLHDKEFVKKMLAASTFIITVGGG